MRAYLINLDRSKDRLEHMMQQFARIGLRFERMPGVDGNTFSEDELKEFARQRPLHSPWSAGLAGCLLGHLEAWRHVAEAGEPFAAVFEDDVHLAADLGRLLASDNWIPPGADVIRLESNSQMILGPGQAIIAAPGRCIHEAVSGSWGAAGYIISRKTAGRAIDALPKFHHSPDNFLFKPGSSPFATTLRRFQVKPAVCIQDMLLRGDEAHLRSLIGSQWTATLARQRKSSSFWRVLLPGPHKEPVPFQP
jgi:glycosyl transferase family 25